MYIFFTRIAFYLVHKHFLKKIKNKNKKIPADFMDFFFKI